MDYLTLLLNTYINEKDIFSEVIQNRQIKIEKEESISKKEFYFNFKKVIENLKIKIDDRFNKRQNELYLIIDLKESKDEPILNFQNELNTIHKNQFPLNLLHLTNDKFRGNLYLTDVEYIESCINEIQYISEIQKDQIFTEIVFEKGLYYFSDTHKSKIQQAYKNLENDFQTKEDFIREVNRLLHSNGLHFYSTLRTITNETEFIKHIQSQYNLYNEYTPNNSFKWLNFTKKCIMYGFGILRIDNDSLKASFMNWYNETIKTITPEATQQPEAPQKNKEIEQYLQSYKHSWFNNVIDKRDKENKENILFYGKVTADVLEQRNKDLLSNEILKERTNLLSNYNKRLYYLTGHTMQLFKAVNDYSNTANSGYLTKIKINEDEVFSSLSEIKEVAKVIKHNIINDENHIAQKIKDYCILMFDDCIDLLNKRFGVDIYKSPLCTHFENVKLELEKSINYDELKIINELSKNSLEAPRQTNTNNIDEVKNTHPKQNPNDWNTDCFELFKYLFDEYYNDKKRTKVKLICIWFYLSEYNPEKYNLKIKKDDYKIFININYGITITNKDKPSNYDSKVLGTLHEHRIKFEDSLK